MKPFKFLKLKKKKKFSYTKLVLLIVIIIILIGLSAAFIYGGFFMTEKVVNIFKSFWSKIFGSKSKFKTYM